MTSAPATAAVVLLATSLALSGCTDKQAEAQAHLEKAASYLADDDPRAAVLELKSALQLDPKNADARLQLGRLYLDQEAGPAALKELRRARDLGSPDRELAMDLARAMFQAREFDDAIALISRDGADTADWKVLEANTLLSLRRRAEARTAYVRALELQADNTEARRGLARIDFADGDTRAARGHVDKALADDAQEVQTWLLKAELELSLRDLDAAQASFQEVLKLSPDLPAGQLGMARTLLAQSRTDDAGPYLRALERHEVSDPMLMYLQAVEARQNNDLKKTQEALREVLRVAPRHAPSQLLMGQVHLLRRELDQAKNMLSSYVAQVPGDGTGRKLLAAVLLELDDGQEAIRILEPLEKATPDDAQVLSLMGTAYMKLRQLEKGREYMSRAARSSPEASAIRTQLAIGHLASGDMAQAATELEAVIEQDPEFQRADFLLVLTRLREGDGDAALAVASRLVEKHPDSAEAYNLLGAVHEARRDLEQARASYQRSAEVSTGSRAAALNLARLDMLAGRSDEARSRFEKILADNPSEPAALMGLAKIASDGGDVAGSLELLEQARRDNESAVRPRLVLADYYLRRGQSGEALTIAEEASRQSPNAPAVLLVLGRSQLAATRPQEAERTLSRLASDQPDSPAAHFHLAMAQRANGHTEAAGGSLERVLELQPANHLARAALGQLYVRGERFDDARALADQLAKDLPDAPAASVLRGDAYQAQGRIADAVAAYRAAFGKNQNSALLIKLILAEQRAGMTEEANQRATRWLEEHPEDAAVRSVLAASTHGGGDEATAIREYEKVLETSPRNVVALNNLAWLYHERGDERALDLAKRAYVILPQRGEIADTYGWLLVKSGRVEQGLGIIAKALESAPNNGDIRFHHAAALLRSGDSARAAEELKSLLQEVPTFSEREQAEALLRLVRED